MFNWKEFHTTDSIFYLCLMRILMVCLGNICRSPIAEGVLQHKANLAGLSWTVESAGTYGFHENEKPHESSIEICKQHGIDISKQKARKLKKQDFEAYDLLLPMANDVLLGMMQIGEDSFEESKSPLFLEALYPGLSKDVPDPYYGSFKDFENAFDLIDSCCDKIIATYSTKK